MLRLLAAALALALVTGCASYNDQCTPLVDNPTERITWLKNEVWLDRPNARHANNALGQAAADSFVWVFKGGSAPADFGVINGGSLRAEGLCVTRNIIPAGALSNGVFHEVMLFENQVIAVDLSEEEVWAMFEHSAERLYVDPTAIASPAGSFLQVSHDVALTIDCTKSPGSRVTALSIGGQALQKPARPLTTIKFRAALSTYLAGGGDGYTMLAGKGTDTTRNPTSAPRFGAIDANIAAAYLKQSDFNQTQPNGLTVENRVTFIGCSTPVRPTN